MDITTNELKTMKAKQLRRLVQEAIKEVLNEDADTDAKNAELNAIDKQILALNTKKTNIASGKDSIPEGPRTGPTSVKQYKLVQGKGAELSNIKLSPKVRDYILKNPDNINIEDLAKFASFPLATANSFLNGLKNAEIIVSKDTLAETDIDEMARIAKGFKVKDGNIDTTQFAGKKVSGVALSDIIDYIKANPGTEKAQLQQHFGFVRPQITNALVNGLMDAGVLVKLGVGGEEEAPVAPGETAPTQASEPEDMFMGSGENPLSMYFDKEPNNDGSEDFNNDEEPSAGEIEPQFQATSGLSDEDYDAFDKYSTLKQRLDATRSNILKMRRSPRAAGDIADKPSSELQRLRDFKASLETRIDALVKSSPYLQAKLGKEAPVAPVVEPEETEEPEPLDEWTINKMQFYAGIRK